MSIIGFAYEKKQDEGDPMSQKDIARVRTTSDDWVFVQLLCHNYEQTPESMKHEHYDLGTIVPHKDDWPRIAGRLLNGGWVVEDTLTGDSARFALLSQTLQDARDAIASLPVGALGSTASRDELLDKIDEALRDANEEVRDE